MIWRSIILDVECIRWQLEGFSSKTAAKERSGSMVLNSQGTSWPLRWRDEPWTKPNRFSTHLSRTKALGPLLICRLLVWLGVLRKQASQLQSALDQQSLFFSWIVDHFFWWRPNPTAALLWKRAGFGSEATHFPSTRRGTLSRLRSGVVADRRD